MQYLKEGVIRPDTQAPGLGEAREKLLYYSMSRQERAAYDEHLNAIAIQMDVLNTAKMEGLAEGLAEGRAEGSSERALEIAKGMMMDGLPVSVIAKYTGLSSEEIERLSH